MYMPATMTRRLQLLLDEERYQRVAAKAKRERLSVAAVIRDAIDESLGKDDSLARKRKAWERLQELDKEPFDYPKGWDAMDDIGEAREKRDRAYD